MKDLKNKDKHLTIEDAADNGREHPVEGDGSPQVEPDSPSSADAADTGIPESAEDSPAGNESELAEDILGEELSEAAFTPSMKLLQDQNLRIRADFANYKKRIEREQIEYSLYMKGEILKRMLPVLDDFRIMLDKTSADGNPETLLEGARLIYEKFSQALEKEGLEKIEALGTDFDPQIHEALMMKPLEDEAQHDKVVEVFQEGFKLNEKLLRPSKVIVGKYDNN